MTTRGRAEEEGEEKKKRRKRMKRIRRRGQTARAVSRLSACLSHKHGLLSPRPKR